MNIGIRHNYLLSIIWNYYYDTTKLLQVLKQIIESKLVKLK